jgi:hypothetical protein
MIVIWVNEPNGKDSLSSAFFNLHSAYIAYKKFSEDNLMQ